MGLGDMAKNMAKQKMKKVGKKALLSIIGTIGPLLVGVLILIVAFDIVIEITNGGKNTPKEIYSQFKIENLTELVEIKKNNSNEYYLDFKDDIDTKLDEIIDSINKNPSTVNLPQDREFLKKLMKAELITEFPNLGGEIPSGSSGFQGAVTLRRVTPNKKVGEYKNTGKGDTTVSEEEVDYGTVISNEYIENIKKWENGKKLKLVCDAIVYKQMESQINKDKETGYWEPQYVENSKEKLKILEGTEVTYKGEYRISTNPLTNETTVYVEVESGDTKGYLKSQYLIDIATQQTSNTSKLAKRVKEITSRARNNIATKTAGKDDKKTYTIAIAAGHNNTDDTGASSGGLVEQALTIEVAEKVEELFSEYSNIKVVQTGSTSSNKSGVKVSDRKRLAREANPDLCIQIHFNAGGGTGVEAIYKNGDGISQQLAEILSKTISSSMGLDDRKAGPDEEKCAIKNLGIIENAASSGFPSVVTEGGFLDGSPDADIIKNKDGVTKYAQGIVDGILEYLEVDHEGYTAEEKKNEKITDTIESVVQNMKYVTPKEFDKYIEDNDNKVLSVFTLDKDNKLITASYSDGSYEKNPATEFRDSLQQYTMPFEYLLYFYIDTNYEQFSIDLADKVLNTEIVMVVQDNISTTKNNQTTEHKKDASDSRFSYDWTVVGNQSSLSEDWSTLINITYVDTWFVKTYNKANSFSTASLGMENKDKVIVNLKGKVTETESQSETALKAIETGTLPTGDKDENGNDIMYTYTIYERIKTLINNMENTYDKGDMKTQSKENNFVDLYNQHEMAKRVRKGLLFQIIENNEKTANLLNLTKYLIFKATEDENIDVKEYDFGEFQLEAFEDISEGTSGLDGIPGQIYDFLLQKGIPPVGAAAILGNIEGESSFNPKLVNEIGCSGLCQWKDGRFENLKKLAQKKGVEWTDVSAQLEYLWKEINSSSYKSVKKVIMNAKDEKDLEYATWYWGRYFEVFFLGNSFESSKSYTKNRYEYAQKWYKKFKENAKTNSNGATSDSTGDIKKYDLNIHNGFIEYKQYNYTKIPPSYNATGSSGTIKDKGCMPSSISIILSGMGVTDSKKKAYTPETLISSNTIKQYSSGSSTYDNAVATFKKVGLKATSFKSTSGNSSDMINNLKKGNPLIIHASAGYYTGFGHFMTLIDVKGNNVYLSNPGNSAKNGWINISTLISRNVDLYSVVSK